MSDSDRVQQHLQTALDSILTVLVLNGGDLGDDIPPDALDAALSADPQVRSARQALDVAVRGLLEPGGGDDRHQAVLGAEEATNALVARCGDAGYRLGLQVGRGQRG